MAHGSLKTTVMVILAGTTLSGCSLIGSAADTVWGGTKSAAKFVSTPVRYLLRDAPEEDIQFAETTSDINTETLTATDIMSETRPVPTDSFVETTVTVKDAPVMAAVASIQPSELPIRPSSAQTNSRYVQVGPVQTTYNPVQTRYTTTITEFNSTDVVTVGDISYARTDGTGSLEDWRTCDIQAGGFWTFSGLTSNGTLNPDFETCMEKKSYIQVADLSSRDSVNADVSPSLNPLP